MVRTTGKNNTVSAVFFHPLKGFFTLYLNVFSADSHFFPTVFCCVNNKFCRNFRELFYQSISYGLEIGKGHEGVAKLDLTICNGFYVVLDVL